MFLFTLLNIFSGLNLFYIKSYPNLICNIFEYGKVYIVFCLLYKNAYIEYFLESVVNVTYLNVLMYIFNILYKLDICIGHNYLFCIFH